MLTEKQLVERRKGLGGTDAAKVCGVSKWGTPYSVYLDKKGEASNDAPSIPMQLGHVLEPWLLKQYEEQTANTVTYHPELLRHKEHSFMLANVDGIVNDKNILLELKTAKNNADWGDDGSSDIPFDYLCQVSHYLAVTDLPLAHVFVFFKSLETFQLHIIERDLKLESMIIKKEKDFWENHVEKNTPPTPHTYEDITHAYSKATKSTVTADEKIQTYCTSLKSLKQQMKALKSIEEDLKTKVFEFMGEHEALTLGDNCTLATWKNVTSNRFDTGLFKKEHPELYKNYSRSEEYRRFLIK